MGGLYSSLPVRAGDLLTQHLDEMRAMNACEKRLTLGRRFDLLLKITKDGATITNRRTGTVAHENAAGERAALLAECGPDLEQYHRELHELMQREGLASETEEPG